MFHWKNFFNILCVCVCVTVGNKDDALPEKKVVKTEDAQKFAEQIGVPLYETSAKENKNVEEVSSLSIDSGDPQSCPILICAYLYTTCMKVVYQK